MKLKTLFYFMAFISVGLIACGDDDDDGNVDCNSSFSIQAELQDEIDAFTDAAFAYGNNPTPENCEAYKDAAADYLEAAEALQDCANQVGQGQEYQQALQAAQDSVDSIQC